MGDFSRWLLHEDQKELFEYLFALVLNITFVAITALVLWPMGRAIVAWRLTKGYWIFWSVLILVSILMILAQRFFRMDLYSRFNAYLISGLVVSGLLQLGWSAFAALLIRSSMMGTPMWVAVVLYGVGLISCYVASVAVGVYYMGTIYRLVNSILALVAFVLFSVWPAAGSAMYGWFFRLWFEF